MILSSSVISDRARGDVTTVRRRPAAAAGAAAWAGQDLQPNLGPCDKSDITWLNNQPVGSITMEQRGDAGCVPRCYTILGKLVKAGRNVTAAPDALQLTLGGTRIPLAGDWQRRGEVNFGIVNSQPPANPYGDRGQHVLTALYNAMIAPLVPYAVRYAWADNPSCNLANGAGLPASPFRTDDWPWITRANS